MVTFMLVGAQGTNRKKGGVWLLTFTHFTSTHTHTLHTFHLHVCTVTLLLVLDPAQLITVTLMVYVEPSTRSPIVILVVSPYKLKNINVLSEAMLML